MCGRYVTTQSSAELAEQFGAFDETQGRLTANFNLAPTSLVPVIRAGARLDRRKLSLARWGLVPSWAKDLAIGARTFNARAETVASKPAFRSAFAATRALIPADGWYEWTTRAKGSKQPYYITAGAGLGSEGMAFAGLWSAWGDIDQPLITCSVITTAALGRLAGVHERMPLLLDEARWDQWLDHSTRADPDQLLRGPSVEMIDRLEIRAVGPAVGNVRNGGPELIEPAVTLFD